MNDVNSAVLKTCPFCAEDIIATAIKCKHCGEMLNGQVKSKAVTKNDNLAYVLLGIPLIATAFGWSWIGNMTLMQNPGSSLNLVLIFTILATAGIAAFEASRLGMGADDDLNKKGKKNPGSVQWFFFLTLLWIVGYPYYLYQRSNYGVKNLAFGGLIAGAIFLGFYYTMNETINNQIAAFVREYGG